MEENSVNRGGFTQMQDDTLIHYGVMGMKWGIRKDKSKPAGYQSYRQAKKSIKKAHKAYRKSNPSEPFTVPTRTTGKNVAKVDKAVKSAKANDAEDQARRATAKEAQKKYDKAQAKHDKLVQKHQQDRDLREMHKENMTRLQNDPNASTARRKLAEQEYLKDRDRARESKAAVEAHQEKLSKAETANDRAWSAVSQRGNQITRQYREKYKTAAVKDLGFDDVKQGKKILNDYGLMDYALGTNTFFSPRNLG